MDAVVYLQASLKRLIQRTAKDKKRPLLQVDNPEEKIALLLEQRQPYYQSVSDYVVDTDGFSPKSTVQSILNLLN
jgi:shikimate kinase